jgi:hypothetical protein
MRAPDGDSPAGFYRTVPANKLWVIPPLAATPTAPATKAPRPAILLSCSATTWAAGNNRRKAPLRSAPFLLLRKQPVDWSLETCGLARQSSLRASPDVHNSPKGFTATAVRRDFQTRPPEANHSTYPSAGQDLNRRCRYTPDPPAGAGEKIAVILYCTVWI